MHLRALVEKEVAKVTEISITDELFREAADAADKDILFHHVMFGKRTSIQYVTYIMATMIIILMDIDSKE
jgi:hypothetical protein